MTTADSRVGVPDLGTSTVPADLGGAFDPGRFRHVLGHFATGVAVITAAGPVGPAGMVVSSFTSVSLDPPLVAFLPDKASTSWPAIEAAGAFCVNILRAGQEDLCRQFARKGADKFAGVAWHSAPSGAPVLDGVMAWIDCDLTQSFESGDHYIAIGQVRQLDATEGVPLVFFQGGYKHLGDAPAVDPADSPVVAPPAVVFGGRTLEELARETGTDVAALDRYNRSTDGLIDEIVGSYVREFADRCERIARSLDSATEAFDGLLYAAFSSMREHRVAVMILQNERPYLRANPDFDYLEPLEREIDDAWRTTLRRGIESGEMRRDLDPETTYQFVRDVLFAAARWSGRQGTDPDGHRADAYRELLARAILN